MCGITAIWNLDGLPLNTHKLRAVNNSLKHRGPDDEGYLLVDTTETGVIKSCSGDDTLPELKGILNDLDDPFKCDLGLGFRRLSIIDLSIYGHQPMSDIGRKYWIIFNGEIYNYIELRSELETYGYKFRSGTDTEVVINSFDRWGKDCLNKFNGMWAFLLYDVSDRQLFCARDRFGVKPFYYVYQPGKFFAVASEIKSLLHLIPFEREESSVYAYFAKGITAHSEKTFFKGVSQLMPGFYAIVTPDEFVTDKYYNLKPLCSTIPFKEARDCFRDLLFDAVKLRQRSDVPFGYALSGGIDSSSIVCSARHLDRVDSDKTFSLIFPGKKEDESDYINEVIKKTGFSSAFLSVSANDLINDLDSFIFTQEEPFGGTSYYGEFKLRELIKRNKVTVCLDGQGADEIVTGYLSLLIYYFFDLIKDVKLSRLIKETASFRAMTQLDIGQVLRSYGSFLFASEKRAHESKYPYLNWHQIKNDEKSVPVTSGLNSYLNDELFRLLTKTSIPEQLIRADKSAMAFSVESRFPFLDYRLVEFAMNLPYSYKIDNGTTKYILRESVKDILPEKVYLRKDKIGFAVPGKQWVNDKLYATIRESIKVNANDYVNWDSFWLNYSSSEAIDWKYWKVASFALWETYFQKYGQLSFNKF